MEEPSQRPQPAPDDRRKKLSAWLDSIQQNSWELELLVSGFAIFLLIGALEPYYTLEHQLRLMGLETNYALLLTALYYPGMISLWMLIGSLILHVLFRGLWIAAIGLRYVSGDIDHNELKYQDRFREFLQKRIGHFDDYIERLERSCSITFSVSFVVIFSMISLASFVFLIGSVQVIIQIIQGTREDNISLIGDDIFGIICLILGLLYFIDFATVGFFKRKSWTQRWYYPIYRVAGWLTLARIYRPLYHNLIDNRFGRRLGRLLPLFIVVVLAVSSLKYVRSPYFSLERGDTTGIRAEQYDDLANPKSWESLWRISVDSRYVGPDNYIEVFAPYIPKEHDPIINYKHPDLEPGRFTGIKLEGAINVGEPYNRRAKTDSLLSALSGLHKLYLNDSLIENNLWRFYHHPSRNQNGLIYHLPAHKLPIGEHQIRVERQWIVEQTDSLFWIPGREINIYR
ncbi:MAG: hypothetical protein AAF544_07990 [Bacteroidota bacterium]